MDKYFLSFSRPFENRFLKLVSYYLEILKIIILINYNLVIKIRKCNINVSVIRWLYSDFASSPIQVVYYIFFSCLFSFLQSGNILFFLWWSWFAWFLLLLLLLLRQGEVAQGSLELLILLLPLLKG